jgi:hypothetical protein
MTKKKRRLVRSGVVWLNKGWFPVFIGFCPNIKAWRQLLKECELPQDDDMYLKNDAACTRIKGKDGEQIALVTISEKFDKRHRTEPHLIVSMLVHECVHVWQTVLNDIQEQGRPSEELEAYAMQAIFQQVYGAYLDTRIKCRRG